MTLNENTTIYFDDLTHSYWLGEKQLSGVTSLMKEFGLAPDYSGVPSAALEKAAERGTAIHKLLEDYDNGAVVVETPELKAYKKLALNVIASEYLVSDNDTVASFIDKVIQVDEKTVDLADIKTSSILYTDSVGVQLGFYAYLFEIQNPHLKVRNCYGVHVRSGKAKLVQVQRYPAEQMAELIARKRDGKTGGLNTLPTPPALPSITEVLPAEEIATILSAEVEIAKAKALIKAWEEKAGELKDRITGYMLANHLTEIAAGEGVYKLKDEYTRETIDSKKLKDKYPAIAAECSKTSIVKASITYKDN